MSILYETLQKADIYRDVFNVEPPTALGPREMRPRKPGTFIRRAAGPQAPVAEPVQADAPQAPAAPPPSSRHIRAHPRVTPQCYASSVTSGLTSADCYA